jgi:molybdate transport system regulatory protein
MSDVVALRVGRPRDGTDRLAAARLRLRLVFDSSLRLGPGKIDLLEAIATTGSISAAARSMEMSYRRAWVLIDEVNRIFTRPVVTATSGGANGGGARLTEFGHDLVLAWRAIEAETRAVIARRLAPFADAIADPDLASQTRDLDL